MPAERINVSFEPRPLELLYSKYASIDTKNNNINNKKLTNANGDANIISTYIKPTPSFGKSKNAGAGAATTNAAPRRGRFDAPVRFPRRQELGDLRKLGRELTKVERVQMLLDISDACNACSGTKAKNRSLSQPNSATADRKCLNAKCQQCSEEHKREDGRTKLRDLKSKLRLVAARSLPECGQQQPSQHSANISSISTSPAARTSLSSHRVVPLPLLQLGGLQHQQRRYASSSEDLATLRDARNSLRHVLMYPMPSISRRVAAAAAGWNYRGIHVDGTAGGSGGRPHPRSMEPHLLAREFTKYGGGVDYGDSSEADSSQMLLLPPNAGLGPPACSLADDQYNETATVSTFDADRLDKEQFEYVFECLSISSTGDSDGSPSSSTLSQDEEESDTGIYSARAQRPSTTDTVASTQRLVETRASMTHPPISPASPQQRSRGGESWPPQFTVVPSWPSVDDPYRFQYFGCGVHRDIMRRLHKSRSRRRNGKQSRESDQQQQQPPPPQPQILKVVVPSPTECALCRAYECHHNSNSPSTGATAPHSLAYTASIAGKSAKSRGSLSMSVCTVLSRKAAPAARRQLSRSSRIHSNGTAEESASLHATEDAGHQWIPESFSKDRRQHSSVVSERKRSSVDSKLMDVNHGNEVTMDSSQSEECVS